MKKLAIVAFVAGLIVATTGCDQLNSTEAVEVAPAEVLVVPAVPAVVVVEAALEVPVEVLPAVK